MPDISRLVIEVDSKGVVKATGDLNAFEKVLGKTGKASGDAAEKFGAFQLVVDRLPGPLKSLASGLMGVVSPATAGIGAFLELSEAAVGFAKQSLQAFSDMEMIRTNLELVVGSATRAGEVFDELRGMAGRTPFDAGQLADAAVQLRQTGTATKDLVSVLSMLGDTAGGSAEKFNRIVANFAQIQSVGKASSMDLKQFAQMGIPVYDMLRRMGVEGTATAEQIGEMFRLMTEEGGAFHGAMERGAATLEGKTTNLQGVWKSWLATFAETSGIADAAKTAIDAVTGAIVADTEAMETNRRAREAGTRIQAGSSTAADLSAHTAGLIQDYEQKLRTLTVEEDFAKTFYEAKIEELRRQKAEYDARLDAQRAFTAEIERQKALQEDQIRLVAQQNAAYRAIGDNVHSIYAGSATGRREDLERQLAEVENLLARGNRSERLVAGPVIGGVQQMYPTTDFTALTGRERTEAEVARDELRRMLEDLRGRGRGRNQAAELPPWVRVMQQVLGVKAVTSPGGLSEYGRGLSIREGSVQPLTKMLGLEGLEAATLSVETLEGIVEGLKSGLTQLMQANLDGNNQFRETDNLIRGLNADLEEYTAKLEAARAVRRDAEFAKYLEDMEAEHRILILNNEERERAEFLEEMREKGFTGDQADLAWDRRQENRAVEKNFENIYATEELEREVELKRESVWLAEEEARVRELMAEGWEEGLARVRAGLETQDKALGALRSSLQNLKNSLANIASTGFLDFADSMGQALRDGTDFSDAFGASMAGLVKQVMETIPPLLLQVGLKMLATGNPVGLALIAASGLMSFVSGLLPEEGKEKKNKDDAERLKSLQEQIMALIDAQRQQAEYYASRKRQVDAAAAMNVNDAIITPQGVVNTHPEDYIIATKHPERLGGGGGGAQVTVIINNNSGAQATATETAGADGSRQIQVLIEDVVKGGLASGKFDQALGAVNRRSQGSRISA